MTEYQEKVSSLNLEITNTKSTLKEEMEKQQNLSFELKIERERLTKECLNVKEVCRDLRLRIEKSRTALGTLREFNGCLCCHQRMNKPVILNCGHCICYDCISKHLTNRTSLCSVICDRCRSETAGCDVIQHDQIALVY